MPSKRASTGGKALVSPAKKQRRQTVDPVLEACSPVLKVLKTADDEGSAAEMLCAALPYALRAAEGTETRHAYQEKMLDLVTAELSRLLASRKDGVVGIETQVATLEADQARSSTISEEITSRLVEKTKERDDAAEASKKQQDTVNESQVALASGKEKVASADVEKLAMEKERDDFMAGLTELWEPLKTSSLAGLQRRKPLAKLEQKMKEAGAEPSLLAALPVALKIKADVRPEFAQATLTHSEEIYMKHIEILKERVESFGSEITARASALAEAESSVQAAKKELDAIVEADISAQNVWAEVKTEDNDHKAKMKAFTPTAAKLEKQLEQARTELAHLQEVFDSFESLRPVDAVLKVSGAEEVAAPVETVAPQDGEEIAQAST